MNLLSTDELLLMKESCQLAAETLLLVGDLICEGLSTKDINEACHAFITKSGAIPSPLNYHGFPRSICTSLNDVICHGIPSSKEKLKNGDIVNVDITTYFPIKNGYHGDTNATFYVGQPTEKTKIVVETARECLEKAIEVVKPGNHLGDIGHIIENHASQNGCSVVRDFVGHGIGRIFHDKPDVFHFGKSGTGQVLEPGMIFTIEPMINAGLADSKLGKNKWVAKTKDGKLSAQFEHTILVTDFGCEILTKRNRMLKNSEEHFPNTKKS